MEESQLSHEQMLTILREADPTLDAAAATKNKVSEQPIYARRRHSGRASKFRNDCSTTLCAARCE